MDDEMSLLTIAIDITSIFGGLTSVIGLWVMLRRPRRQRRTHRLLQDRIDKERMEMIRALAELGRELYGDRVPSDAEVKSNLSPLHGSNHFFVPAMRPVDRRASVPAWSLSFFPRADIYRYENEWGAHLQQLISEGELKQARRDRHRLMMAGITLAIVVRVRRRLRRST
jgi:hypothetical protein